MDDRAILLRLLSWAHEMGRPVTRQEIAEHIGRGPEEISDLIFGYPGKEWFINDAGHGNRVRLRPSRHGYLALGLPDPGPQEPCNAVQDGKEPVPARLGIDPVVDDHGGWLSEPATGLLCGPLTAVLMRVIAAIADDATKQPTQALALADALEEAADKLDDRAAGRRDEFRSLRERMARAGAGTVLAIGARGAELVRPGGTT